MNYLETGLPHTDFVRRKTDFSPPRFIPLCSLGRKYRGLEPLTSRELVGLIRRLSEPKRNPEIEDPTPVITQVQRKATPGTGRFVGQKKMSSYEIEKMVDRLYSRRATKDYAFVDETVEADDITNMTNRNDDSSDSENESEEDKIVKDRNNSLLRRQSSVKVNAERMKSQNLNIRRESATLNEQKSSLKSRISPEKKEVTTIPSLNVNIKPKTSVTFQRAKSLIETKKSIDEHQPASDKRSQDSSYICTPNFNRSNSSPGQRVQPSPSQRSVPSPSTRLQASPSPRSHSSMGPSISKSDVFRRPGQIEESSTDILFQAVINAPKSHVPELSRPSSSNFMLSLNVQDATAASKGDLRSAKGDNEVNKSRDKDCDTPSGPKKLDSPRQKISKTDAGKPPRFAVAHCDELLIDRVATYNRSSKLRCK